MIQKMVKEMSVPEEEIVKESGHCLHPAFLEHSLNQSLDNLKVEAVDILYIHNPYEAQAPYNLDHIVFERLAKAFEFCEKMAQEGKIANYGVATYSSLRQKPDASKMHLSIQKLSKIAT